MLNHQRYKNIMEAKRTKSRIARLAIVAQSNSASKFGHKGSETQGWYLARKRAVLRLRNLSGGSIALIENGYRGHHRRHWMQDCRCEHVFKASLKEVLTLGAGRVCPFCNVPDDLQRCGSVQAVMEMVDSLGQGNIEFLTQNKLGGPDDLYFFACLIHRFSFEATYRDFIREPENFCDLCTLEKRKK